jgi:hypothetical protein
MFVKNLFSADDKIVATMVIIIVSSFALGSLLLIKNSMTHGWTIDDTAFSAFFITFITGGVIKMASDSISGSIKSKGNSNETVNS